MSKISYILVNYRTPELTCSCLESLYAHCGTEAAEVIVVDNGSLPGNGSDAARIRKAFPQTIVIESPDNIGFGNACNLAATGPKENISTWSTQTLSSPATQGQRLPVSWMQPLRHGEREAAS